MDKESLPNYSSSILTYTIYHGKLWNYKVTEARLIRLHCAAWIFHWTEKFDETSLSYRTVQYFRSVFAQKELTKQFFSVVLPSAHAQSANLANPKWRLLLDSALKFLNSQESKFFELSGWFRVNGTQKRTNFPPVEQFFPCLTDNFLDLTRIESPSLQTSFLMKCCLFSLL